MPIPEPPKPDNSVTIVNSFRPPESNYGPGHRGLDLAAAPGSPVVALADGVVTFAGLVAGKPVVTVRLASGMRTTYEPVVAAVAVGQPITRGDVLGTTADTPTGGHCAAARCLHIGLRLGQQYFDPASLLDHRIVLKPD